MIARAPGRYNCSIRCITLSSPHLPPYFPVLPCCVSTCISSLLPSLCFALFYHFLKLFELIGLPIAPFHNFFRTIIHFDFVPSVLHVLCRFVLNSIESRNVTARSYPMLPPYFDSGRDYDNDIIIINLLVSRAAAARKKAHKAEGYPD